MEKLLNFEEYQILASRTINHKLPKKDQELHSLFGMVGEIGELHSLYQKIYQGHSFDKEHACSELGDLLWFIAEWCTANNVSMAYLAEHNIKKLEKRYKDGFTVEESLHRAKGDI